MGIFQKSQRLWDIIKPYYHNQDAKVTLCTVELIAEDKATSTIRCVYNDDEGGISALSKEQRIRLYRELMKELDIRVSNVEVLRVKLELNTAPHVTIQHYSL